MPTATAYFGYSLANLGPLTTTYTAPASCATDTHFLGIAAASNLNDFVGKATCSFPTWRECIPSGAAVDSMVSRLYDNPAQGFVPFYSPGLVCPSGWTTAGIAAYGSVSSPLSLSGVFTDEAYQSLPSGLGILPLPAKSVYLGSLDPDETLVFCCPSGYLPNPNGVCYSSVGPVTESSLCFVAIPETDEVEVTSFDGSSWSPVLLSVTAVETGFTTVTETIPSSAWPALALVTEIIAVALIHQATDVTNAASSTTATTTSEAAPAVARVGTVLWLPIIIALVSTSVGAALIMPI
ncbi:hypothetical protein BJ170DRAFT_356244 [Xylariales sp. AK1849]|nr:hypothetical protein BJ170DRAFT_356244 [Xylariales sp. AK1849]